MVVGDQLVIANAAEAQQVGGKRPQIGRHQIAQSGEIVPGLVQHPQPRQEIDQPMAPGFMRRAADHRQRAGNVAHRRGFGVQPVADGDHEMARMQKRLGMEGNAVAHRETGGGYVRALDGVAAGGGRGGVAEDVLQIMSGHRAQDKARRIHGGAASGCDFVKRHRRRATAGDVRR